MPNYDLPHLIFKITEVVKITGVHNLLTQPSKSSKYTTRK